MGRCRTRPAERLHGALCEGIVHYRPITNLPSVEAGIEAVLRHMLGQNLPSSAQRLWQAVLTGEMADLSAPRGYRSFRRAIVARAAPVVFSERHEVESRDTEGPPEEAGDGIHRARRRKSEQAERNDSLILHKFEAI